MFLLSPGICPVLCSGNGDYDDGKCGCYPGWKGPECQLRHDECVVADCGGHGRCVNGECQCSRGWTGQDCGQGEFLYLVHIWNLMVEMCTIFQPTATILTAPGTASASRAPAFAGRDGEDRIVIRQESSKNLHIKEPFFRTSDFFPRWTTRPASAFPTVPATGTLTWRPRSASAGDSGLEGTAQKVRRKWDTVPEIALL